MQESKIAIAPMMKYTDRHFRYLMRLLVKRIWLYTEMVHTHALLFGDRDRFLSYHQSEQPLALQLGGSEPKALAECATMAEQWGYAEVNLNVGCPSDRVQKGVFGACLMEQPEKVADCVDAMQNKVSIPITVKTRIGIDHHDDEAFLHRFIRCIHQAGCQEVTVHARKAWLKGLNPKQNRTIPPLNYERVYQLKREFPDIRILINGGIKHLTEVKNHLNHVDGVMIGREAYHNPYWLTEIEQALWNQPIQLTEKEWIESYYPYVEKQLQFGVKLSALAKHLLAIFQGKPGAKKWRRLLTSGIYRSDAGVGVLKQALNQFN